MQFQPPNDIEVEQCLLWCLLMDKDCFTDLELVPDDFYNYRNQYIYKSIKYLQQKNIPVDLISVKSILDETKNLTKIWWIIYLTELIEIVPTTTNFHSYQKILKEKSQLRKLLRMSQNINNLIFNEKDPSAIIWEMYSWLSGIENNTRSIDMASVYENSIEFIDQIKSKELLWLPYWEEFKYLSMFTGWIQDGNVIRIWGWSNVWKTWLLYNILLEVLSFDDRVTFFSIENKAEFTMKNLYWLKKWVNSLPANIQKYHIDFSKEAVWFYEKTNFYLDDDADNLEDIFRRALKNKSKFIFIDYIQLVEVSEWSTSLEKLKVYWKRMQRFAEKNRITVFDLSQLSNEVASQWVDGPKSDQFEWWAPLKNSCDVWIHLFNNTERMKAKQDSISFWDKKDFYKNFLYLKVSKNRLWPWVWSIHNYVLDFTKWWKYLLDSGQI